MAKPVSENIEMLMRVVDRLAPLLERFRVSRRIRGLIATADLPGATGSS